MVYHYMCDLNTMHFKKKTKIGDLLNCTVIHYNLINKKHTYLMFSILIWWGGGPNYFLSINLQKVQLLYT